MSADERKKFEQEFLIRLAAVHLGCRWRVMGNQLLNWHVKGDLAFDLLGMTDYAKEMQLMCKETLKCTPDAL